MQARFEVARLSGSGGQRRKLLMIGPAAAVAPGPEGGRGLASVLLSSSGTGPGGVDVDVMWDLLPALKAIAGGAGAWRLWRYDAVVIVADAATGTATVRLQRLLAKVATDLAEAGLLLLIVAFPAGHDRHARSDRLRSAEVEGELRRAGGSSISAETGTDGSLVDAPAVVLQILQRLAQPPGGAAAGGEAARRRDAPQDEGERQRAVDRSLGSVQAINADLQRVVMLALASFDVPFAQVNLVSHGRLRSLAYAGRSSDDLTDTLSGLAVLREGPLLIEDTHADPRFAAVPETRGPGAIRFYAGYPIESLDGYRIGVVCILDTVPHEILAGDDVLLRDIALLAEAELIALGRRAPG